MNIFLQESKDWVKELFHGLMACGMLDPGEVRCPSTLGVHIIVYLLLVNSNNLLTADACLTYIPRCVPSNVLAQFGAQDKSDFPSSLPQSSSPLVYLHWKFILLLRRRS